MIMTPNEYLEAVLKDQELAPGGPELIALSSARADIEKVLRAAFADSSPRYATADRRRRGP